MIPCKTIIFDADGVLIEADNKIRVQKYKDLFNRGLKLVSSKDYVNSKWIFDKLKGMYDRGEYKVNSKYYKLIDHNTPKILSELSKKHRLLVCSLANKKTTFEKLKATKILKYFKGYKLKPLGKGTKDMAVVDDRFNSGLGSGFYIIKFNYGQHKKEEGVCDIKINNLRELL